MQSIAHIRESDKEIQTVKEHLLGVKGLAESYGKKLGIQHITGLAGLLHDVGKYTYEFRDYIERAVFHPELAPRRGSVDHSTAGGRVLYNLYHKDTTDPFQKILAEIVGNAIISHHSYLQDFIAPDLESNYLKRVRDKELCEFTTSMDCFFRYVMGEDEFYEYVGQALVELKEFMDKTPRQMMFLTKYIFSALIDADRTDTRRFEEDKTEEELVDSPLFESYYGKLMDKLRTYKKDERSNHPINVLRADMSEQCDRFAENPSGIYTLSIPTGGGKTLASLRYALKHAQLHRKQRIIYVVPFTTIIEQNAKDVRDILQDDIHVLEHHSNVIENERDEDEDEDGVITKKQKLKLARDNWDSPIIFTTMVQFLNVFYAKGNRNTRRLHNLSNAVLIFDEVQKVPVNCISLFNEALNFLKNDARSSVLLCTATQPALDYVNHRLEINPEGEIIDQLDDVMDQFKRVEIIDETTSPMTNEQLAEWILEKVADDQQSLLAILNTKTVVKDLYERLKGENLPTYHLSTSMCATHRKRHLREMKDLLKANIPFICVTSQLIEAGVDVSFDCVVRSLAGLDSIAQAAGRCNRHGEHELKNVYVIDHAEEKLDKLKEIKEGKALSKKILIDIKNDPNEYGGHLLSREAMEFYFKRFYHTFKEDLNYPILKLGDKKMTDLLFYSLKNGYTKDYVKENETGTLELMNTNSYRTAADHFHVIDDSTIPVLVPYKEGKNLIAELNSAAHIEDLTKLLQKAQQYTVNLYPHEFNKLTSEKGVEAHLDGLVYELKEGWYSNEYGVDLGGESELEIELY
ncbi:CRISPR-associated helicase/endonuclease Cas3 [Shouchella shacheensis]|uniref:CRISPR-associated helicase/endonuclease Cas3 n=1 Tax=Shouchella shacheensis TaxID=1649580 RepID=UPI00073FE993|nr:CRISPR-associated helicase/endonuclease Cas3 [Shouchella shacheensis]